MKNHEVGDYCSLKYTGSTAKYDVYRCYVYELAVRQIMNANLLQKVILM